jgi:hypothetical protein
MNINKCSQTVTLQGTLNAISHPTCHYFTSYIPGSLPGIVIRVHTTKICEETRFNSTHTYNSTRWT